MRKRMNELSGKVVVITGSSSGLGEQLAYESAKCGATIVICARRMQLLEKVKGRCQKLTEAPVYALPLDIAEPESVEAVFEQIISITGKIDILVNSAGFGSFTSFLDFPMKTAEKMFRVNVLGLMYLTQKVAIHMAQAGSGHIITIASQAGKTATAKSSVYSATKFAVLGFSNALRLELKPLGIAVTTVNPGPIRTEFFHHAANGDAYLEKIGGIVLDPSKLAKRIVNLMGTKRRELNTPLVLEAASRLYTLFPHIGDILASSLFNFK